MGELPFCLVMLGFALGIMRSMLLLCDVFDSHTRRR